MIDADYRTGDGDGNLPAEELRAEVVLIGNIDADDGMAACSRSEMASSSVESTRGSKRM